MASGCFLLLALTRQTNHPLNIPISSRSAMTHQNAIYAYENVSFTSRIWFETHDHITEEDCCLECSHCSTPFFKPVLMTFVFYNPCMSIVLWIYAKGQSYLCVNKLSKKKKNRREMKQQTLPVLLFYILVETSCPPSPYWPTCQVPYCVLLATNQIISPRSQCEQSQLVDWVCWVGV